MWHKAWICERKSKKGIAYSIRWISDDGCTRTESVGTDKKFAEAKCKEKEYELNNGLLRQPKRIRLSDFASKHLEVTDGQVSPAYLRDQRETLVQFQSSVGDGWLTKITSRKVEVWFSSRLKEVSTATANKSLRTLKAVFNKAKKRGYLEGNPFVGLKPVRELEKELRVLSTEEIGKILGACPDKRWRAFVYLALTTGARSGELCALTWDDIDFDAEVVTIRNKDDHPTKSRRNRQVGLLSSAAEMLKELPRVSGDSHVFQSKIGGHMGNNLRRDFLPILERAGVERCTIHDLRRTFLSHLAMSGTSGAIAQKLAGHASIHTTMKHYTRVFPAATREAQEGLPYAKIVSKSSHEDNLRVVEASA